MENFELQENQKVKVENPNYINKKVSYQRNRLDDNEFIYTSVKGIGPNFIWLRGMSKYLFCKKTLKCSLADIKILPIENS